MIFYTNMVLLSTPGNQFYHKIIIKLHSFVPEPKRLDSCFVYNKGELVSFDGFSYGRKTMFASGH